MHTLQSQKTSERLWINRAGSISGGQTSTTRIELAGRGEINPREPIARFASRSPVRCARNRRRAANRCNRYVNRANLFSLRIISLNACNNFPLRCRKSSRSLWAIYLASEKMSITIKVTCVHLLYLEFDDILNNYGSLDFPSQFSHDRIYIYLCLFPEPIAIFKSLWYTFYFIIRICISFNIHLIDMSIWIRRYWYSKG